MGLVPTNESFVVCNGCGEFLWDTEARHKVRIREGQVSIDCLRAREWRCEDKTFYCPKCRPKLTLPERWRLVGGTLALDTTQVHCKAIGGQNACPIWAISDQRMGILKDVLPIVLACEVSAAAVRIAYDAIARPADFNRGEILALLAQALRAAEPEVTP